MERREKMAQFIENASMGRMLLIALWLAFEGFVFVESQQLCDPFGSFNDWRLVNHTFLVLRDSTSSNCFLECEKNVRCQSYNFRYDTSECELNKRARDARPDDLIPFVYSFYMDRTTRVPLGSIAEVPAISCSEINATNPNALNGRYWIDKDGTGQASLQLCIFKGIESCDDVAKSGITTNGIYNLIPPDKDSIKVFCKVDAASQKGWIMVLKREDGSVDFNRNWTSFKTGFGNLSSEHWLGLENIHRLTKDGPRSLRFELEDWGGVQAYAEYSAFGIDDEAHGYNLTVSGYSGDAGDSFIPWQNGQKFTTPDRDNDAASSSNCAVLWGGSWWHLSCFQSCLTGPYRNTNTEPIPYAKGVIWYSFKGYYYSLKRAEMMIR